MVIGIGVGVGLVCLQKQHSSPAGQPFSDQQISQAKQQLCHAYDEVHKEVTANSARDQGTDPIQQLAVTATMRQAFLAGSAYLFTTISEQAAAPPDLVKPMRQLAIAYEEVTIGYLNGKKNTDMEQIINTGDEAAKTIQSICG